MNVFILFGSHFIFIELLNQAPSKMWNHVSVPVTSAAAEAASTAESADQFQIGSHGGEPCLGGVFVSSDRIFIRDARGGAFRPWGGAGRGKGKIHGAGRGGAKKCVNQLICERGKH